MTLKMTLIKLVGTLSQFVENLQKPQKFSTVYS